MSNGLLKIVGTTALFCKDSATLQVNAYYRSHIALPNAFSPNGDGLNDVFYVIAGKDVKQVKQFQVFNRWGQKMFEKTNGKTNDTQFWMEWLLQWTASGTRHLCISNSY